MKIKLSGANLGIKQVIFDMVPELRDISSELVIILRKELSPAELELNNAELYDKVARIIKGATDKEIDIPRETSFQISQQLITAYEYGSDYNYWYGS